MVAVFVTLALTSTALGVVTTSTAQAISDASNETHPAVAMDPSTSNFFVVAESDDGRVYGTRVSSSGSPLDAPIALSPSGAMATSPTVA